MRLGQKSVIHFLSRTVASVLGFVASVYIARLLGADVLGTYSLATAVVSWLGLVGTMGFTSAVKKRVSEQQEPSAYAIAGLVIMASLFFILSLGLIVFSGAVNDYIGSNVVYYIIGMVAVSLGVSLVSAILNGQHLVHISGLLGPIKTGSRAGLQIAAILASLSLAGLLGGYIIGYMIVVFLGSIIVIRSFDEVTLPRRHHFSRILAFAKFSWLGNLRSQAFNWVDIAVLGFFVSNSFIGYYTASWNIAMFLVLFGSSLSQTLFPEISKLSAEDDLEYVSELINSGLSYAGLFLIPGLVGGAILGNKILRIYGSDFTQAWLVLTILIAAALIQSYQAQITNTLNAIDHPELSFRVNITFITANVILNIALIYIYGWTGAAVATASSVAISLCVAYYYLSSIVQFDIPVREIINQSFAAILMAVVVLAGIHIETVYLSIDQNIAVLFSLVLTGATVYFAILFVISAQFRDTVSNNLSV